MIKGSGRVKAMFNPLSSNGVVCVQADEQYDDFVMMPNFHVISLAGEMLPHMIVNNMNYHTFIFDGIKLVCFA